MPTRRLATFRPCQGSPTGDEGHMSYFSAVRRVQCRKGAFATAKPHSVLVLARVFENGSHIYNDGKLCYLNDRTVRILDV